MVTDRLAAGLDRRQSPARHAAENDGVKVRTASLPYPDHLLRQRQLADGRTVVIRPVRPGDQPALHAFFDALSPGTRHLRFQRYTGALTPELMHFYTHIDYDRHMAFVCEAGGRIVGDARYVANPGTRVAELGIVVADDWHHTGIAQLLLDALMRAAQARGFEAMEGLVLAENRDMLDFVRLLGFEIEPMPQEPTLVRVAKKL
jgi:acetyltransferase